MTSEYHIPIPSRVIDISGQRFGRLTVLQYVGIFNRGARWKCRCDCGVEKNVNSHCLGRGTFSCGCFHRDNLVKRLTTHGMSGRREFFVWWDMKERCGNEKCKQFHFYGARGITVCERWVNSFANFYEDMGERPPGKGFSIERIDNSKGYSPDNCKWATSLEQARNTRRNHRLTFKGRTMCVTEWAGELNIPRAVLFYRIRRGWETKKILTTQFRSRSG